MNPSTTDPPHLDRPPLSEGDPVLLWSERGASYLVVLRRGSTVLEGRAVIDLAPAIGQPEGFTLEIGGRPYLVLRPTLPDLAVHLRRRAQIITPKDALALIYLAGVGPGARVAEAGSGSGGLTVFLAHAVGTQGQVFSYDLREDHQRIARENLERTGLADRVSFSLADVRPGVDRSDLDAWILDLPDPWEAIGPLLPTLHPGGRIATYVPTYNQLERTVRELRSRGLVEVQAQEILERGLHVGEGGTRPEFEMLGHTGFLAGARKVR